MDQQIFSKEASDALTQLYSNATELSEDAKKLSLSGLNSVFNNRTPRSSDTSKFTATAIDAVSQDTGATEAEYEIAVLQLAQSQHNTGYELHANATSVVREGTNTFEIITGGESYVVGINVQAGDTNEDVLQKVATAINDSGAGVIAYVINGATEGRRQLFLIGEETGLSNNFTLEDSGGNVINATGAATLSTPSQNAQITVNGSNYASEQNVVYLDNNMITVTLKKVGKATLTISPDKKNIVEKVKELILQINAFLTFLANNANYIKEEISLSLDAIINGKLDELESIGITPGENGILRIDFKRLEDAINKDMTTTKRIFGTFDGLAVRIDHLMSQITTGFPLQYTKEGDKIPPNSFYDIYSTSKGLLETIIDQTYLINTYM
jgi:flagellar hook-associated protein 2